MANQTEQLRNLIAKYLEQAAEEFQIASIVEGSQGKIQSGSWSNDNLATAYVSYYPNNDPSADSIDAKIDLHLTNQNLHFAADVSFSSGKILAEFEDTDLFFDASKENNLKLEKLLKDSSQKLVEYLKTLITSNEFAISNA